jgi:putative ATP-dependent endonuclease of the OLD family
MYLSHVKIKHYRSIKQLALDFRKGKNVIVGKNNAGKSNVVKAIDLVLGEPAPAYHKYENLTINDFHLGDTSQGIVIWVQLCREPDENLNYDEIYKAFGYKIHAERRYGPAQRHNIRFDTLAHFFEDASSLMNISEDEVETSYINPKLRHQGTFEEQFEGKTQFAFCFTANFVNNSIQKQIRLFYRENEGRQWIMAFSASVRNELMQSAVIKSFRDPANELRINQWSWFGKMLRASIDTQDPALRDAFSSLKDASNNLFSELQTDLSDSQIRIAFPGTTISFQFNPDTRVDVYKSTLIYVDDGFNSLLQDKGSGIQSAVIIGLFDFYTRRIAHSSCSLLVVEEPELYLHPQARRVISNRLDSFIDQGRNQVILTTHSSEFITAAYDDINIILARKEQHETIASNTIFEHSKDKQLLLKVQNAEMFFADLVILVEGGDKFIFEAICQFYGKTTRTELGEQWLNDRNISIIATGGKNEFWKYHKKLTDLKIPVVIIADFDFLLRGLSDFLTRVGQTEVKNELDTVKSRLSDFSRKKRLDEFSGGELSALEEQREKLKALKIFVIKNELEDNFTAQGTAGISGISGKEEKPIHIVCNLVDDDHAITEFVNCEQYVEVIESIVL